MHNTKRFAIGLSLATVALLAAAMAPRARAHEGRRLNVLVIDDQLFGQGYLSGLTPVDDGGGIVRPYYNAIHDHWQDFSGTSIATLPGFDVPAASPLAGFDLSLEVLGAAKWVGPPTPPPPGTVPDFVALTGETITAERNSISADTDTLGTIPLVSNINPAGAIDLDLIYSIGLNPSAVIYDLQVRLTTDAPGISPSGTIHLLLSPDGSGPVERLHHASLLSEQFLGVLVPEPSGITLVGFGSAGLLAFAWRRRAARRKGR